MFSSSAPCQQFHTHPNINPLTGRQIQIGGPTYQSLVRQCGPPPTLSLGNVTPVLPLGNVTPVFLPPPVSALTQQLSSPCQQFLSNPNINPYTGRTIQRAGPTYQSLYNECVIKPTLPPQQVSPFYQGQPVSPFYQGQPVSPFVQPLPQLPPVQSSVQRLASLNNACVKYIIGRADEDRYNMALLNGDIEMYAVYDGHGGKEIANYLRDHLPEKLALALLSVDWNNEPQVRKIIQNVFIQTDIEMRPLINNMNVGSTATVALKKGNKIYLANLADSRAIIYDSNGNILLETIDHDGKNPNEVRRVKNLGGEIYGGRVGGSLAVTRAFGDYSYKRQQTQEYNPEGWVSALPDTYVFNITQPGNTLLIASDGLWEGRFEESTEVVSMIQKLPQGLDVLCDEIARIGREYYPAYNKDDITVIIKIL